MLSSKNANGIKLGRQLLIDVLHTGIKEVQGTKEPQRRTSPKLGGCEGGFQVAQRTKAKRREYSAFGDCKPVYLELS